MIKYVPFLFDNFIEDDAMPIFDLSINHSEYADNTSTDNYSTPEILDKIRDKLVRLMDND